MNLPTAEKLANLAYQKFDLLPKTGKPSATEWTILSAIVMHKEAVGQTQVVAIGCGTKCIGASKLSNRGIVLNDSHAEVLARRGFLRYLYHHLKKAAHASTPNEECIFLWDAENAVFQLRPHVSFHFVSTHIPCGDACISREFNIQQWEEEFIDEPSVAKRQKIVVSDEDVGHPLANNAVFTGAKLIGLDAQHDAMQQNFGAMRTKPGRGDRTLSMSCSDKLARWNVLGVQGALLDALIAEPIYFETLNFCGSAYNEEAIKCAIYKRFTGRQFSSYKYQVQKPEIRIARGAIFHYAKSDKRQSPSSTGISWCDIDHNLKYRPYEVTVSGKRLGVIKKKLNTPNAALKISKYYLMTEFVAILSLKKELLEKYELRKNELIHLKYMECKKLAKEYQAAWALAKEYYFQQWTQKPANLLDFGFMVEGT